MPNISKVASGCIKNLKSNPDIINSKANKGSQIIVMNKSDYLTKTQQLIDNRLYKKNQDTPCLK